MMNSYKSIKNQSGFTLILSLVILVILTILSLSSMQSTRLETAMAGNMRESDLAFQAAEIGLDIGEGQVENSISHTDFNNPGAGLYGETDDDPDYYDPATWGAAQIASVSLSQLSTDPAFIIKYLGKRAQNPGGLVNISGYGGASPGKIVHNFRITARGVGQTTSAPRTVQSYYGREF